MSADFARESWAALVCSERRGQAAWDFDNTVIACVSGNAARIQSNRLRGTRGTTVVLQAAGIKPGGSVV